MPTTRTVLRCLVISPGDVGEERDAVVHGIADFNARFGGNLQVSVEAVRWETHATPDVGAEPQAIINRQIVDDCDLAIAIFWTRLGTPTAGHPSGSAEEVAKLRARGAPVLIYFSNRPAEPSQIDAEQFARLQELRDQYRKDGLLGAFDSVEQLQGLVPLHLVSHVGAILASQAGAGGAAVRPGFLSAALPDVRVRVDLVDMVDGGRGLMKTGTFVRITAENHSPQAVFLTGPSFGLRNGRWAMTERDSVGSVSGAKREVASGDSTTYLYAPRTVEQIVDGEPGELVVHDAIGRRFRSPEGALAAAAAASRARAKTPPATFKERAELALNEARAAVMECTRLRDRGEVERAEQQAVTAFDRLQAFTTRARSEALEAARTRTGDGLELMSHYEDEGQRLQDALLGFIRRNRS